jgi:putative Holliday junction resolvase
MNVKRYARGPVFWVVIVVVLVIAFSNIWGSSGSYKSVQTGQVVGAIDAGNITNAVVHDKEQIVQVTLKTALKDGTTKIQSSYAADQAAPIEAKLQELVDTGKLDPIARRIVGHDHVAWVQRLVIDAAAHWPERGALIGLDLGTKTIGVAVSDPDRRLATGVETIQRKAFKADAARLLVIATERNAVGFVLGLPINMDASEGPRAQSTRAFARNFSKLTDFAIALWDERLSTVAVERELIDMDMSRARRALVIDEHAAIFILQGALDRLAKLRQARGDR